MNTMDAREAARLAAYRNPRNATRGSVSRTVVDDSFTNCDTRTISVPPTSGFSAARRGAGPRPTPSPARHHGDGYAAAHRDPRPAHAHRAARRVRHRRRPGRGRAGHRAPDGGGVMKAPEQKFQYETGWRYAEINTILRRIRRRRTGEPTAAERARLAELRQEIADLKAGAR